MVFQYLEVIIDYMFVDNVVMKMFQDFCFFDVMVIENIFGDILIDEGFVISGFMGLFFFVFMGESILVFEFIYGLWLQVKGLNIVNLLV